MQAMLRRYPHIGKIIVNQETANANGIPTITPSEIIIKGRYEPTGQKKALDYSAKFYCANFETNVFQYDGATFIYEGKQFKIVQLFPYQTHCEIWLD